MKVLWIVLGVVAMLFIGALVYLGSLGMFGTYAVEERLTGPYTVAYESFTGPYAQTGPVFDKVYSGLKAMGIDTELGIGLYYDDPANVPADKLHSECGVVLAEKYWGKTNEIVSKFSVKTIAQKKSLVLEFPINGPMSYMFGPMKAYPELGKAIKEKGYTPTLSFELYDEAAKKILFVFQVE